MNWVSMSAASTSASKPWFKRLDQDELLQQDPRQTNKVFAKYGCNLSGKTFVLWGQTIKPNTNDMRDAPSRVVIGALLPAGARIRAHVPVVEVEAKRVLALDLADAATLLENLQFAKKAKQAVQGANALIIVTECQPYRLVNWTALKAAIKTSVIFDGLNLYKPGSLQQAHIEYYWIGR